MPEATQQGPLYDPDRDKLKAGDTVVHVRDTKLAAALIAVGIPLRHDPPYTHIERADGQEVWTFCFYPSDQDGEVTTAECIDAWHRDLDFIAEYPLHPFSFAMAAVKNLDRLHHHMHEVDPEPQVAFRVPTEGGKSGTMLLKKNSKKYKAAVRRGFKQL